MYNVSLEAGYMQRHATAIYRKLPRYCALLCSLTCRQLQYLVSGGGYGDQPDRRPTVAACLSSLFRIHRITQLERTGPSTGRLPCTLLPQGDHARDLFLYLAFPVPEVKSTSQRGNCGEDRQA